jgi:TIR domain
MASIKERKKVGTLEERFLAAIEHLQDTPSGLVIDRILRDHLDWKEERYNSTKASLKNSGKIIVRRGPGGPVKLPTSSNSAKKVFISYSHVDAEIHRQLVVHLQPLCRQGLIEIWHDQLIKPGQEWEAAIWSRLDDADIVLLLISADFISSEFCYRRELDRALERHAQKELEIIPIIARNCVWHELPFGKLQALPDKGVPICSYGQIDDALTNVASGILKVLKQT